MRGTPIDSQITLQEKRKSDLLQGRYLIPNHTIFEIEAQEMVWQSQFRIQLGILFLLKMLFLQLIRGHKCSLDVATLSQGKTRFYSILMLSWGNGDIGSPYIEEEQDPLTFPECYIELKLKVNTKEICLDCELAYNSNVCR